MNVILSIIVAIIAAGYLTYQNIFKAFLKKT